MLSGTFASRSRRCGSGCKGPSPASRRSWHILCLLWLLLRASRPCRTFFSRTCCVALLSSPRVDSEGIDRRFHSSRSFPPSFPHSFGFISRSSSQDIDEVGAGDRARVSKVVSSGLKGDRRSNRKGSDPPSVILSRRRGSRVDPRGRDTDGEDGPTPCLLVDRTAGNEAGRAGATAPNLRHVMRRWSRARARR